jgi:hypothetical protein
MRESFEIPPDLRLSRCPTKQAGLSFPIPLDQRIDSLCELADEEGAATSRKELVAALILDAPAQPKRLAALIKTYRKAAARNAAINPAGEGNVLHFQPRKPGRRPREISG